MIVPKPSPGLLDLVTPSDEAWRAMSKAERDRFLEQVSAAYEQDAIRCGESRPHLTAKISAFQTLTGHFERSGRRVYLASELAVLYPGESPFYPDLLAVVDVPDPVEDDTRTCWSVTDEGRGLDLALEITYSGDKQKDLVSNVARYARLGIPEYFVYDRRAQKVYGYRLAGGRYASIPPRRAQLESRVLGLALGVLDGRLRFFANEALVPETGELLERLERLVGQRTSEIEALEAQISERDQRLAERDQRLAERDQRLAELEAELAALRARLAGGDGRAE